MLEFLKKNKEDKVGDSCEIIEVKTDVSEEADLVKETEVKKRDTGKQVKKDFDGTEHNDEEQIEARELLVKNYQVSLMKKQRVQKTSSSVKILHRKYMWFERMWKEDQGVIKAL